MPIFSYLLARFSEPSSYAGLGALLAVAGVHFSDSDVGPLTQFLGAGCALAALLLKERGMIQVLALMILAVSTLGACTGPNAPTPATIQTDAQIVLTRDAASDVRGAGRGQSREHRGRGRRRYLGGDPGLAGFGRCRRGLPLG